MSLRRLPVYLVLDCSESMAGSAIDSVNQGVSMLLAELKNNPQALETVFLSVITFSHDARQVVPLTELLQVQVPRLSIQPGTALGAALKLLADCLKRDVVRTTATQKGDYRPLVFLMTDGQPTDIWEPAATALASMTDPKIANLYAIGCGDDINTDVLYRITDVVLSMPDMSPEAFKKFFVWMTASVSSASKAVGDREPGKFPDEVKLPDGVLAIAPRGARQPEGPPRQVFLRARCSKTKKRYLMRYVREPNATKYTAKAAHKLDDEGVGGASDLPPVDSSQLVGIPPCPHCGAPRAGLCPCGELLCNPADLEGSWICPSCGASLTAGRGEGSVSVRQSQG